MGKSFYVKQEGKDCGVVSIRQGKIVCNTCSHQPCSHTKLIEEVKSGCASEQFDIPEELYLALDELASYLPVEPYEVTTHSKQLIPYPLTNELSAVLASETCSRLTLAYVNDDLCETLIPSSGPFGTVCAC